MIKIETLEIPVRGMDCADCASHVQKAIASLPGVQSVNVLLAAEKAVIQGDIQQLTLPALRQAVAGAGYSVPDDFVPGAAVTPGDMAIHSPENEPGLLRAVGWLFAVMVALVLFIVVVGEWMGLFDLLAEKIPWFIGYPVVLLAGLPVFRHVARAALNRQVLAHTMMSLGVIAALAVGEWVTALIVVLLMRVGSYVENFTAGRSRQALRQLTALAPLLARLERDGQEIEVKAEQVQPGDMVIVRPGEKIPVDGEVISGQAAIDQAAITGESMPVEASAGTHVFAATLAHAGMLRIRATRVGTDTTFGRIIRLVEEAEAHRGDVQRMADKFAGYYLPVVAGIALLTLLLRGDPLAMAAVLVVACSCSFALATPIAMLASIGAAAKSGVLIKGGKYLEALARADVLLIDKTGTLTMGRPRITDAIALSGMTVDELLHLAATAERHSGHPLAAAVRQAAHERGLSPDEPDQFEDIPGFGIRARIDNAQVTVGSQRMNPVNLPVLTELEAQGKTALVITHRDKPVGVLAAADTLRPEIPPAIAALKTIGLREIRILSGDNERVAGAVAGNLGIAWHAGLLPEDKIALVKQYQAQGHTVVMVGDGVNDAPALAQADIGIAMGAAGTDVAIEAAHITLMRDDWTRIPEVFAIARRTMRVVRLNIGFTMVYNLIGLTLAAFGILPPALAAAAQSLPDIGILVNSSRLLREEK